jgi:hypothetical protein
MQTKIQKKPSLSLLKSGSDVSYSPEEIPDAGYIKVKDFDIFITLLDIWECPSRGIDFNWAKIKLTDKQILSVEAVELSREVLKDSYFISDECISEANLFDDTLSLKDGEKKIISTLMENLD